MKSGRQRDLYLRALLTLSAAPSNGLTLRECARVLGAYDSSVRQALVRLVDDDVASTAKDRYAIRSSRRSELELERARFELDTEEILRLATRASGVVELAAFDPRSRTLHLVIEPAPDASAVLRLREVLGRIPELAIREHSAADIDGTTVEDAGRRTALRREIAGARLLQGDVESTLPVRPARRRSSRGLGHLHPSLREPSRREKQRLARRYGLDELSVFGSAARSDFRPDSDVDALVHFRHRAVPTLGSYGALAQDLGELLDRRVDVIDASSVDSAFIPSIERDRVTLYGRPHALVSRAGAALRTASDRRQSTLGRELERGSGRPRRSDAPGRSSR